MYALFLGFATAFVITYVITPIIIRVARERRIYDQPNERSSHQEPTPSLGGVGIFVGTVCGILMWTPIASFGALQYILAALVIIFLIGILDDLLPISPVKKLAGQVLVAVLLSSKADIRVSGFYGLLGIHELPEMASYALSIVAIVGIINAFNLIDGIDGLAGSIGFMAGMLFGAWFFTANMMALAAVAFSLAGAVAAFLRFNFTPARIFMGDTGSLLIGTVCAILSIDFIEINYKLPQESPVALGAAPAIAVAVLILPLYDTLSVFMRRIVRGRSPFRPDKTHIHHQLLSFGLSHSATTIVLILVNLLFILLAIVFNGRGLVVVSIMEAFLAFLFTLVLVILPRIQHRKGP